jgi:membrane protein implicated in regulation of membrane protease activity
MNGKQIWALVAIVAVLIIVGLVAGWAWSAGAAAAGAAAAAKALAGARARQKVISEVEDAQTDVQEASDSISVIVKEVDEGTVEINKEISTMTPEEKIALAKELLTRAEP